MPPAGRIMEGTPAERELSDHTLGITGHFYSSSSTIRIAFSIRLYKSKFFTTEKCPNQIFNGTNTLYNIILHTKRRSRS